MKSPVLKNILKGLLSVFLLFALLMSTPRIIGFIFPSKPPIGYHYDVLSYLALGVGLEQLIDMEPEIPGNISEIKDVEYKNVNGKSLQINFIARKMKQNRCRFWFLSMAVAGEAANARIIFLIW